MQATFTVTFANEQELLDFYGCIRVSAGLSHTFNDTDVQPLFKQIKEQLQPVVAKACHLTKP